MSKYGRAKVQNGEMYGTCGAREDGYMCIMLRQSDDEEDDVELARVFSGYMVNDDTKQFYRAQARELCAIIMQASE